MLYDLDVIQSQQDGILNQDILERIFVLDYNELNKINRIKTKQITS